MAALFAVSFVFFLFMQLFGYLIHLFFFNPKFVYAKTILTLLILYDHLIYKIGKVFLDLQVMIIVRLKMK